MDKNKIAVLIPCYNEELTIVKVVSDFQKVLPHADIYVYDNNSSDRTYVLAQKAGAIVCKENQQGKGNVVRTMFREVNADVYILVDGDDTYPAEEVGKLIAPILEKKADMVIGDRLSNGTYASENKRNFHDFGNNLVRWLINFLFQSHINDIMTGYRAYSRKFVKSIPIMSDGFQIETEMTIFSLVYKMKLAEVPIIYRDRPKGSVSKLNTVKDGCKVLVTLFDLFKNYRPLLFFGLISVIMLVTGLLVGTPVIIEYVQSSYVSKLPSAVLATALCLNASIFFAVGIVMDSIKNQTCFLFEYYINQQTNDTK